MKIKIIIDFTNKNSLDLINYFNEYRKTNDLDLEIHGFDVEQSQAINKAYYGLYYSNKYGVGLEFTKRVLDAYHLETKDIGDLSVVASCFEDIGYNRNDIIDAMMEGDYGEMHKFLQTMYLNEEVSKPCTAYIYDDEKQIIDDYKQIIEYVETKKT